MLKRCAVVHMVMGQQPDANEGVGSVHSMHSRGRMADGTIAAAAEHQLRCDLILDDVLRVKNDRCG